MLLGAGKLEEIIPQDTNDTEGNGDHQREGFVLYHRVATPGMLLGEFFTPGRYPPRGRTSLESTTARQYGTARRGEVSTL